MGNQWFTLRNVDHKGKGGFQPLFLSGWCRLGSQTWKESKGGGEIKMRATPVPGRPTRPQKTGTLNTHLQKSLGMDWLKKRTLVAGDSQGVQKHSVDQANSLRTKNHGAAGTAFRRLGIGGPGPCHREVDAVSKPEDPA